MDVQVILCLAGKLWQVSSEPKILFQFCGFKSLEVGNFYKIEVAFYAWWIQFIFASLDIEFIDCEYKVLRSKSWGRADEQTIGV